ncbi:hypothetical protein KBY55_34140 [Streptomyces sp. b94]|nr:hypothetical protein [Streptomyces sp. b94]MBQ1100961.1 hypothetical protein [Streptomyces sp. b94]
MDIALGQPDDPLLQAVVMPISERELRETLTEKIALFEPAPRADPVDYR